jgi:hypothetical protein
MKTFPAGLAGLLLLVLLTGCRSAMVHATVQNTGNAELRNIEVDYPNASFGLPTLAPGQQFQYEFQTEDPGRLTVKFEDAGGKSFSDKGPAVVANQRGTLQIDLNVNGHVGWHPEWK